MENIKYSILVCAYSNGHQFHNFLYTACRQEIDDKYEIIVVDNATPTTEIYDACKRASCYLSRIKYYNIQPDQKKCKNITQGINFAAVMSKGEYIVIVADSNVLLSFNLLSEIDKIDGKQWKIIISGQGTDIKISPNGNGSTEYSRLSQKEMMNVNANILEKMGWPDDPYSLRLIEGKYRYPPPHNNFDIYIAAMHREVFLKQPYNENLKSWGDYHANFIQNKCREYASIRLTDVKIIHQFHRVWKNEDANIDS